MLSGDSVKRSSSLVRNDSGVDLEAVSFLILFDDFVLFELLESPSNDLQRSMFVLGSSDWHSLLATVYVRQKSYSSSWSDVNFSGK